MKLTQFEKTGAIKKRFVMKSKNQIPFSKIEVDQVFGDFYTFVIRKRNLPFFYTEAKLHFAYTSKI